MIKKALPSVCAVVAAALAFATACGSSGGSTSDGGEDGTIDAREGMDASQPSESGPSDTGHDVGKHDTGAKDVQAADVSDSGPADGPIVDGIGPLDSPPPGDVIGPTDVTPPPYDVGPPPFDGPPLDGATCTGFTGGIGISGGTCENVEQYTCGAHSYQITCDCPSATCSCQKDFTTVGASSPYVGCPGCMTTPPFVAIAAVCGIPY